MLSIMWVLLIAPPLVSWLIWRKVCDAHSAGETRRRSHMPRYGFWVILGVSYLVMFAAAVVERKF